MANDTLAQQLYTMATLGNGRALTGVSIAARASLSAHALNNEGTINNAQMERQVNVVKDGEVVTVNAVSGDVLKHGFIDHLRALALGMGSALPICAACQRGDPNRINEDRQFQEALKGIDKTNNAGVVDELVRRCVIDDLGGLLVTQGNRNAPRRSVAQFGWLLGVPDHVRTQRYTHIKLALNAAGEDSEGSNRGQNLFTRPASSGQYAFVTQLALGRIGYNDISAKYVIDPGERARRAQAALEALYLTLAAPSGSQRNTQLPHVQGAQGVVCFAFGSVPPVLYSPLEDNFGEQMRSIAGAFGHFGRDLALVEFETIGELGEILQRATAWVGSVGS
jgi:CRISPR-associated protein Cst2